MLSPTFFESLSDNQLNPCGTGDLTVFFANGSSEVVQLNGVQSMYYKSSSMPPDIKKHLKQKFGGVCFWPAGIVVPWSYDFA